MAFSETQQKLIALGEQLVASLGAAHQLDLLSRWMAHYVAEQIQQANTSTGVAKVRTEKQAFETILALWAHRARLPDGLRPFEGFEPILRLLGRLDPENPRALYHRIVNSHDQDDDAVRTKSEKTMWLDFVKRADYAARILIEMGLSNAAAHAVGASTEAILDSAEQAGNDDDVGDVAAINTLLGRIRGVGANPPIEKRIEQIERRIAELAAFRATAQEVEALLQAQSREMKKQGGGALQGEAGELASVSKPRPSRNSRPKRSAT